MRYKKQLKFSQVYSNESRRYFVNKAAGIGIIVAVVIGIIIVSATISMEPTDENELGFEDEVGIVVEESEVVEEQGRDLSVEFTETIGLKSP